MKYTDRKDITGTPRKEYDAIAAIFAELQKKRKHVDTTDLMIEINKIISDYVELTDNSNGNCVSDTTPTYGTTSASNQFDISAINFDLL
ncbi:MAG: hypothetical protein Q4F84_10850, partial [Fibrobacter sp.]|nr:hypothetical protein [Fibrobacter sp.]